MIKDSTRSKVYWILKEIENIILEKESKATTRVILRDIQNYIGGYVNALSNDIKTASQGIKRMNEVENAYKEKQQ